MIMSKRKMLIGALTGATAMAGATAVAVHKKRVASASALDKAASNEFKPSPERLARRELVDRENMAAVYAAKPASYKAAKRAFDVALSGIALVGLSPIMIATSIAIIAEDGLPVFYKSERPGKDMKPFGMLKFRSMYKDADKRLKDLLEVNEQTGAAFKIKDDPRITKVGHFIRKYSIDELPQLVNILKGDCSIVGPRAIVPTEEFCEHERQRQIVQPGLTAYWQVMGRAAIPWEEWVELDLDYIQDMCLIKDAELIVRTVPAVLAGDGGF
jgi:lipopolysaccharide/colanic/teichoic acid biosynthesis glycosyltransferase